MKEKYKKFFKEDHIKIGGYIYEVYKTFSDGKFFIEPNSNNDKDM
jgi:hypothetical protein